MQAQKGREKTPEETRESIAQESRDGKTYRIADANEVLDVDHLCRRVSLCGLGELLLLGRASHSADLKLCSGEAVGACVSRDFSGDALKVDWG